MRLLPLLILFAPVVTAQEARFNGFDVFDATIPTSEIFEGGVPRDGIESLSFPKTVPADAAEMLDYEAHSELISYTSANGITRAYPLAILRMHEAINDVVDGEPIVVTYCPLCKTAMVFSRQVEGQDELLTFGISGLLHNSDVLLYDRETESLWTQLGRSAISGPLKSSKLVWLPARQMRVHHWAKSYPDGEIVSVDTGKEINYRRWVFASYHNEGVPIFRYAENRDDLAEFKEVYGVVHRGESIAITGQSLYQKQPVFTLGGQAFSFSYDHESRSFTVYGPDGALFPSVQSYWFAWQAFYPETRVLK